MTGSRQSDDSESSSSTSSSSSSGSRARKRRRRHKRCNRHSYKELEKLIMQSRDSDSQTAVSLDPVVLLKIMTVLVRMGCPSIDKTLKLLLSCITTNESPSSTTNENRSAETRTNGKQSKKRRPTNESAEKNERMNENYKWKCYLCYRKFVSRSSLSKHLSNTNLHKDKYCVVYRKGNKRFCCGFCGNTLSNKGNVKRHINVCETKGKHERKHIKQNVNKQAKDGKNSHYMWLCTECEITTPEMSRAVEHAQFHQMPGYAPIPRACEDCKYKFESNDLEEHKSTHNLPNLTTVKYAPLQLLTFEWSTIFRQFNIDFVNRIKSSNIYEYTRKVKMNTLHVSGKPLYQCDMCGTIVRPEAVEAHCDKETECVYNQSEFEVCDICSGFFETAEELSQHEMDEKAGVTFRVVTFNNEKDLPINRALRNFYANNSSVGNNGVDRPTNCVRFCKVCRKPVANSDYEKHNAGHRAVFNEASITAYDSCDEVSGNRRNAGTDEDTRNGNEYEVVTHAAQVHCSPETHM